MFEAKKLNPQMSMAKAEALLEAYQRIRQSGQIHRADKEENKTKIQKPPLQKWFKVNVDATINSKKQLLGLGVMIIDSARNVMAAAVKTSRFYGDVSYAKGEAIRWRLQVAENAGLASLIIETNSQMVAVVQILLNSQVHESIIEQINSDKCRSHEEVNFNYVQN